MGRGGFTDITAQKRDDYLYRDDAEPHKRRAEAIRKAHPEVTKLMGPEPLTKYIAVAVVLANVTVAYFCKDLSWPWFILASYAFAGTFQANLFLAIHEISHNLAFKSLLHNRLLGMFCNLPLVIPYSYTFKPYHMDHHRYQGDHHVDTDIPTTLEAKMTSNPLGKFCWLFCQIFAYAFRPMMLKPDNAPFDRYLALNWAMCLSFDLAVYKLCGPWMILYFLLGMLWAASFHPTSGHFLSEHYVWEAASDDSEQHPETYSYYGPLNIIAWNVGFHNEHHDFPNVAWSNLPKLRKIAPEFYNNLPQTNSWPGMTLTYLLSSMNGFNRVKRTGSLPSSKRA